MSGTRIGPPPPAPNISADHAPRPAPVQDLADALADLAHLLVRDSETTRLAKAQSQIEALLYAAQLAVARGDAQGLRGVASEAGRIARDLGAAGTVSDQANAIIAQAGQVRQMCDGGENDGGGPLSTTDLTA